MLNKDIVIQVYIVLVYSSHARYHLLSHQSLFLLIPLFPSTASLLYIHTFYTHAWTVCVYMDIICTYMVYDIKSRNHVCYKHRDEITSYDSVLHSQYTVKCLVSFSDMIILARYSDWSSVLHGLLVSLLW